MKSIATQNRIPTLSGILIMIFILFSSSALAQSTQPDTLLLSFNEKTNNIMSGSLNTQPEQGQDQNSVNLLNREYLSGNWGGIRSILNDTGLEFEFVYKADLFSNLYGGFQRGTKYLDNIDLIFSADLGTSINWSNTNITVHFLGNGGGSPCELVGASQGISNIETTPTWKLYQLLLEKKFYDEKFSVAIGLYDLNSEFDVRETSGIFINPSHGIGDEIAKSGLNGPSIFPTTSAAIRLKYESDNGSYIQAAVLDGVPGNPDNSYGTHLILNGNDGLLLTTEYGLISKEEEVMDSKIAVGGWLYTAESYVNISDASIKENNYGLYFTAEKVLFSQNGNTGRGLIGFLRIGYANSTVNPVDFYLGMGLKFDDFLVTGENDEFGIAMALSHNATRYRITAELNEETIKQYEINLEATYLIELTPWLRIQPDIQYIINPSYCTFSSSAFVFGSRFEINF
jgi:porin